MLPPPALRFVPTNELRRAFSEGGYWEVELFGALRMVRKRDGHPSSDSSGEPFCTRSQVVADYDADEVRVAVVHQYLRPDRTIGGSGRPDPKLLMLNGIVWRPIDTESGNG